MDIHDSVALVTGANRGLGRALAEHLLDRGARKVYAAARRPESVDIPGVEVLALDITDPDQARRAAERAADVTLLVNNAGTNTFQNLVRGDLDDIRSELDTHLYGTLHMAMELLSHAAGIKLRHVPHAGAGPALTAILGGHVDALASGPAVVLPHIKAGKLRALAGWGDKRVAALPEVPTFKELGYPDAEFYIWAGLFAPRGTPEPVLARLREATRAAVAEPEFKSAMDKLETPIVFKQGDDFQRFFDSDARRLAAGVRKVGRIEDKK